MSNVQRTVLLVVILLLALGAGYFGRAWLDAQEQLTLAQYNLFCARTVLDSQESEVTVLRQELSNSSDNLLAAVKQLHDLRSAHNNTTTELQVIINKLSATESRLNSASAELLNTKAQLTAVQSNPLRLHNPTLAEVTNFLRSDKTDAHAYIPDVYTCSHFARDVNNNAEKAGIRCAFVDIRFPDSAHAIIAFETLDSGLAYFDPQYDTRVHPVFGKEYWRCVESRPGYTIIKPDFDDTIKDIVIIW